MILDTSFLVDLLRGRPGAVEKAKVVELEFVAKTSSITAYELQRGSRNSQDEKLINELLNGLIVLNFTKQTGLMAGKIAKDLKSKGNPIDPEDVMIAASAILENGPILTKNWKHFERINGLSVLRY